MPSSLGGIVLSLCPFVMCAVFFMALYRDYQRVEEQAEAVRSWIETPCQITRSTYSAAGRQQEERLYLEYEYEYEGERHRGTKFRVGQRDYLTGEWSESFARKVPEGSETVCYVNPAEPSEAVLNRLDVDNPTWALKLFGGAGALWLMIVILSWRSGTK